MGEYTFAQVIAGYLQRRRALDDMAERHKAEMAPIKAEMERLSGWLNVKLTQTGQQSAKTEAGTAYFETRRNIKVADPEALHGFCDSVGVDFSQISWDSAAIKDYIDANDAVPSGVEVSSMTLVKVRSV
jgi:hypothetical protein